MDTPSPYTHIPLNGLDALLEEGRRLGAIKQGNFHAIRDLNLLPLVQAPSSRKELAKSLTEMPQWKLLHGKSSDLYDALGLKPLRHLLEAISRLAAQDSLGVPGAHVYMTAAPAPLECMSALEHAGAILEQAYEKHEHFAKRIAMAPATVGEAMKELSRRLVMINNHVSDREVFTRAF